VTSVEQQVINNYQSWLRLGHKHHPRRLKVRSRRPLVCPSASIELADSVFAKFDEVTESVVYFEDSITISEIVKDVVDRERFQIDNRLTGQCITRLCVHWDNGCRLGWFVSKTSLEPEEVSTVCTIKDSCRWRAENGSSICAPCSRVRNIKLGESLT